MMSPARALLQKSSQQMKTLKWSQLMKCGGRLSLHPPLNSLHLSRKIQHAVFDECTLKRASSSSFQLEACGP